MLKYRLTAGLLFAFMQVYTSSAGLDSDAIVHFVRALAAISLDELRDASAPRVFSLTKIVEIAHYNMTRIRLVWSRIWAVLAEYFIAVGCHANLAVAMYAVDSLRQLAMKFLERDELANYTFQNDFLRPFVVVMRQSQVGLVHMECMIVIQSVCLVGRGCAGAVAFRRAGSLPHAKTVIHPHLILCARQATWFAAVAAAWPAVFPFPSSCLSHHLALVFGSLPPTTL